MSVLALCGWETGTALEGTALTGTASVQATVKRSGGYALRSNPTTTGTGYQEFGQHTAGFAQSANVAAMWARFYFRIATAPASTSEPFANLINVTANKLEIRLTSDRKIAVYNAAGTLVATGTTVLTLDTWYRIDITGGNGTTAAYEVRIDGVSELSGTCDQAANNVTGIRLGKGFNRNSQSVDFYYDDFRSDNAEYPPNGHIDCLRPNGNGALTAWAIGAGSGEKWEQIDEMVSDENTSYLVSAAYLDDYTATLGTAAGITGVVRIVRPVALHMRNSTSNGAVQALLRSGTTTTAGNSRATTTAWAAVGNPYATNPATSAAWTLNDLEALEAGFRDNLNGAGETVRSRVTWLGVMVDWEDVPLPTTVANAPADAHSTTTNPPLIDITITEPNAQPSIARVQATNNPDAWLGGAQVTSALESGSGTPIHPNPSAETTWEGKIQVDDRVGMAFRAKGGWLDSVDFRFSAHETSPTHTDGTYLVRVYRIGGLPIHPVPAVWQADTPYTEGQFVRPTSTANADVHFVYECTTGGTSHATTEPTWPGNGVAWKGVSLAAFTDGTVQWTPRPGAYPENPADPADTPTPGWVAQSTTYAYAPGVVDTGWKQCDFVGAQRIRLEVDGWYMAILDWWPNDRVNTNALNVTNASLANATAPGSVYLDGNHASGNNGPRIIEDSWFRVREEFDLVDAVSDVAAGFENLTTPADTSPFNSGEALRYTKPTAFAVGWHRWRAQGTAPAGSNLPGAWSGTRTFTITTAGGASAVLTGSAIGGITEADIVAGGKTIVITLTGDTFITN